MTSDDIKATLYSITAIVGVVVAAASAIGFVLGIVNDHGSLEWETVVFGALALAFSWVAISAWRGRK